MCLRPWLSVKHQANTIASLRDCAMAWCNLLCYVFAITMGSIALGDERADQAAFFEKEIRPVLVSKCLKCHGQTKQEGGLRLDSLNGLRSGGESGSAFAHGSPSESLIIEALKYESFEMPPDGQLDERTIQQFERWIAMGAAWPEDSQILREGIGAITEADRQWWAFQPVSKIEPPSLSSQHVDANWARNPIDDFVLARLAEKDMRPAPRADKAKLIRRLYVDVLGIPPSLDEIDAYLHDTDAHAWERLVDRLLQDERYGEHWARYWLDLVRYSESDGWNQDAYRPEIWRYRDYVVNAFNADKPYPEFVRQQLAGDEIDEDDPEHLIASGFLRLGIYEYNQRDARGHWNDIMNEMTDVAGDVFFGMSMACARCHDHKFDPIPQRDYFKLRAFFEPISWRDDLIAATQSQKQEYQAALSKWEEATQEIRGKIDSLLKPYNDRKWLSTVDKFPLDIQACFHMPVEDRTSWQNQMAYLVSRQFVEEGGGPLKDLKKADQEKHNALLKELAAFDSLKPAPLPSLMTATDFQGLASPTMIPDAANREPIEPGFLSVMPELSGVRREQHFIHTGSFPTKTNRGTRVDLKIKSNTSGRRTDLATWIGNPDNPLTTRVIVNRIWQQHFGEGLVSTSSDFGINGQRPTHPELLDWLTAFFVENGWSFKTLHKQILMSATWQQSAHQPHTQQYQVLDPAEALLWRARVRRLQAEQIRDAMLGASGELILQLGGPSVEEETPRRALYVKSFRNKNDSFMHGFDVANGLKSVAVRDTTTTPTQALLLINGQYAISRAQKMAERLQTMQLQDPEEVLRSAFRIAWGIQPTEEELQSALKFVDARFGEDAQKIHPQKLVDFCHVLFNSNQFLYIE